MTSARFLLPNELKQFANAHSKLKAAFGHARPLTLDGLLVGELGEIIAAQRFGLRLAERGQPGHDAIWNDIPVQIKATTGEGITYVKVPSVPNSVRYLIAMRLDFEGAFAEVVYNGPEHFVLAGRETGKLARISLSKLRLLQAQVRRPIPVKALV